MQHRENFAARPDGPPATLSGDIPAYNFPHGQAGDPWIRGGFLTVKDPLTFKGGSYRIVELGAPVVRIGARFSLTPPFEHGGLLALSIQDANIASTSPAVPRSPMHFWLDANGWNLDVNDVAGTDVDTVISRKFDKPLLCDRSFLHTIEITLRPEARECHLDLPDGSHVEVAHPLFAMPGNFAYVEPFKLPGGTLTRKSDAFVREWWSSTE